jgi:hypothetical protein
MEIINGTYTPRTDKWKVSVGVKHELGFDVKCSWVDSIPSERIRRNHRIETSGNPQEGGTVNYVTLVNDNAKLGVRYEPTHVNQFFNLTVGILFDEGILGEVDNANFYASGPEFMVHYADHPCSITGLGGRMGV